MKYFMSIDCGGTAIKYSVINSQGQLLYNSKSIITPTSQRELVTIVESLVASYNEPISGLAFSVPGYIDSKTGYIAKGGALTYLDRTYFFDLFTHLQLPISIENDGRCFAIAEKTIGSAQNSQNFICFIIGTGIGTGIVVNGELLRGETFHGGEFGWGLVAVDDELLTYHQTCSTTALIQLYKKAKKLPLEQKVEGYEIFKEGLTDPLVNAALNKWYYNIAIALFNLVVTFNPEKILLGGGVSAQAQLPQNIEKALTRLNPYNLWASDFMIPIEATKYQNDSAIFGAFYHFKSQHPTLFS